MAEFDLSIIIVSYNTRVILKECLESIYTQTRGLEYEIFVVDNASCDGSPEMVRENFPEVRFIENRTNLGFASANNQGIKLTKGEFVLLLNSDTIILDNAIAGTVSFMQEAPDAGVVGCKVLNTDKSLQFSCYHMPGFFSELIFFTKGIIKSFWDPITYYKYMKYWDHNSVRAVDCISGCFLLVRKQVFNEMGFLDENIFMYYEDADFCARVKKTGRFKIMYYPLASIIHLGGKSGTLDSPELATRVFRAARYYFRKQNGMVRETVFVICCAVCWSVEYVLFMPFSVFDKFRRKRAVVGNLLKMVLDALGSCRKGE